MLTLSGRPVRYDGKLSGDRRSGEWLLSPFCDATVSRFSVSTNWTS